MIDSPLKWVGGKSKLRKLVIAMLPPARCYVEAFAGAGWVLFGKEPSAVEVINDANGDLVNLYRVIKHRPAELQEEIEHQLYSREMFLGLRQERPTDELRRAVWMYALISMAFGADVSRIASASFGYGRQRGHTLGRRPALILPAAERLKNVYVEHGDFAEVIRRYDQAETIHFVDPPYVETTGYAVPFTAADHERLAQTLRAVRGRYLLTINDHPLVRELYAGAHITEAREARSLSKATEGRAGAPILIITNYETEKRDAQLNN